MSINRPNRKIKNMMLFGDFNFTIKFQLHLLDAMDGPVISEQSSGRYLSAKLKKKATIPPLIARFMGPTWGPSGADRTQVGPMLAPWTLLSGISKGGEG